MPLGVPYLLSHAGGPLCLGLPLEALRITSRRITFRNLVSNIYHQIMCMSQSMAEGAREVSRGKPPTYLVTFWVPVYRNVGPTS